MKKMKKYDSSLSCTSISTVCIYIYISLSLYIYIYISLSLYIYIYMHIFIVLSFGGYISTIPSHPHHAQVDSQGWILRGDPAAPRARRRGERQRKAMGAVAQHRSRKGHKDHKVKRTSLVGGLEHFFKYFVCLQMLGIIIPIDFHIFQRG